MPTFPDTSKLSSAVQNTLNHNAFSLVEAKRQYEMLLNAFEKGTNAALKSSQQSPVQLTHDEWNQFADDLRNKEPMTDYAKIALDQLQDVERDVIQTNYDDSKLPQLYGFIEPGRFAAYSKVRAKLDRFIMSYTRSLKPVPIPEQKLLRIISIGDAHLFIINFLMVLEDCDIKVANNMANNMLFKTAKAIESQTNSPLQEFYGQNDPKQLRGQIKPGFNHTFKDTDQFKEFLLNHYFLKI